MSMKEKGSSKRVWDWRIWVAILVVLVLISVLFSRCVGSTEPDGTQPPTVESNPSDPSDPSDSSTSPTEDTVQKEPAGNILITGIRMIECTAGSTQVTTKLENPAGNAGKYYLMFEIRLPDDSAMGYEVLYRSEPVEPGECIYDITFTRALERDIYDAILHVQPLRMDEGNTPTNNVDLDILLVVE